MALTSTTPTRTQLDVGLLILRLVTGLVMAAHGYQKVFTFGLGGITQGFTQMGVPMPGITAPLVAFVELLGGVALIFGIFTRLAAIPIAIDMLGAIFLVHFKNGFFLPQGYEFALTLLGAATALAMLGAGGFSVDGALDRRGTVRR
jgi:putative oxidoreductase